jgi:flagellar biosynthetic protein FlhB
MADSFQEKTEQPTEKRLEDARKKGQVAQSPELASCFVILFLSIFLYFAIAKGFSTMFSVYAGYIRNLDVDLTPGSIYPVLSLALKQFLLMVTPIFALLVALAVFTSFVQTGFMWSFEAMMPKFDALNPANGIKKMFSKKSFFEVLKSLIKIAVLAYILYSLIMKELPAIMALADQDAVSIVTFIARKCYGLAIKVGAVFLFVAGLDYLRQRWQQKKDLMMTAQEVKEEAKERDGNPLIKSRIRSLQREMARRRMIEDVKKADVVVTNPTHFAVAIKYVPSEMSAPRIVAKGAGIIAEKIKEVARSHGVSVVENQPLARGLYHAVKVGDYIPETFYMIVAELLAHVYKKRNRGML